MTSQADATVAVLVVHRPQGEIEASIAALAAQVGGVVVIDNTEAPALALQSPTRASNVIVLHNGNRGGLAGAYNRALEWLRSRAPVAEQVVFVDDDSDPGALRRFLIDPEVAAVLRREETAAVAPAYRERATGLRGKYMQLRRCSLAYLPREFDGLKPVAFVINSMSVWPMAVLHRIGPFNEALAIDHVDTEYCLRARRLGLSIWVHGSHEFAHSIGHRRRFRLLGRELQAGGHGPARRALIARNTTWLARRWLWREPAFALLCMSRLAYEAVGILMAEDERGAKLWALVRGAAAGLVMRAGR